MEYYNKKHRYHQDDIYDEDDGMFEFEKEMNK